MNSSVPAYDPLLGSYLQAFSAAFLVVLQAALTIIAARLIDLFTRRIWQPRVVAEMIAGIMLGPSFLGALAPSLEQAIFPDRSFANLQAVSQTGLVLFMFLVGLELDLRLIHGRGKAAVVISHVSIVFPFLLGLALSTPLFERYAPTGAPRLPFALFIGIAMSITAFPVLARIIDQAGLRNTEVGTLALTCAAADDLTAWCLLAIIVAIATSGSLLGGTGTLFAALLFLIAMLVFVRPMFAKKLGGDAFRGEPGRTGRLGFIAVASTTLAISAFTAERIGIHALFGAFLAGLILPAGNPARTQIESTLRRISTYLLPLFFAFTGLRTHLPMVSNAGAWTTCAVIILVATLGKFGGALTAARMTRQSWNDSLIIGALMNTRGLMELVVLNIGYDLGILSTEIFSIMVMMALCTTFATGPALHLLRSLRFPVGESLAVRAAH